MTRFDDYIERATERLRSDPFVHRDVRRELEAHLEDAAEEARAGGAAESEAEEHALKAFGDADALAEQLYAANRTRMRLRWWGKWATRLVLVPAALALAVVVGAYGLAIARRVADVGRHGGDVFTAFVDRTTPRPREGLTEQEQWLYRQTVAKPQNVDTARAVMERFPNDPAAYAYFIRYWWEWYIGEPKQAPQAWIAALERGREVDPDNALYDYLLAYTLLERSTEVVDEKGITFEWQARGWRASKEPVKVELPTLRVTDAQLFRRAMGAAQAGFRKPMCTARVREWAKRTQSLWVEPKTYQELLAQWAYHAAALMPHLQPMRQLARRLPGAALALDGTGAHADAVRMAQQMDRPGIQMGADAHFVISVLVARDMFVKTAGAAPQVLEKLGEPRAAQAAEQAFQGELNAYAAAVPAGAHDDALEKAVMTTGGIMAQEVTPSLPGFDVQPLLDTTRLAEHVLAERVVLAVLLALGSVLLLTLAAASAWSGWRHPAEGERPLMLFIGRRRLALVLLVGLALPLALYALETRVAPWRSLCHGINRVFVQRLGELGIAAMLMVFLTCVLAYRAVRARCEEAGLAVPPGGWFNPLLQRASYGMSLLLGFAFGACAAGILAGSTAVPALGLLGLAFVVTVVASLPVFLFWQVAHLGYTVRPVKAVLQGLLTAAKGMPIWLVALGALVLGAAALLVCGIYTVPSPSAVVLIFGCAIVLPVFVYALARTSFVAPVPEMAQFRRTLTRSLIPVLAACVLALGLVANLYLSHAEAAAIAPLNRSGFHWYDEVAATDWANYRAYLSELNVQWLREHAGQETQVAPQP